MPGARRSRAVSYNPETSIGFLLYKAHQRSFAEVRRLLDPMGLTPPQFGTLAFLYRQDGQSQAALCERGSVDPNTMVGIVDRLEAAGLVRRSRDPRDRRAYVLKITPKGRRVFEECVPLVNQVANRFRVGLSAGERRQLRQLLRKVIQLLDRPSRGEVPSA
jgi:MarR family transcriptional regulator, lower aerobic nicotinate degradation pathway regulator